MYRQSLTSGDGSKIHDEHRQQQNQALNGEALRFPQLVPGKIKLSQPIQTRVSSRLNSALFHTL